MPLKYAHRRNWPTDQVCRPSSGDAAGSARVPSRPPRQGLLCFGPVLLPLLPALLLAGPQQVAGQGAPGGDEREPFLPLFDARARYEAVESGAFELDARALTLRVRTGLDARLHQRLGVLVEVDANQPLGMRDFNSTVNSRTQYPVVVDPQSRRLNRLQISLRFPEGRHLVVGRQRVIHDDARFVGNVGFRQNEQTLDAIRLQTPLPGQAALDYVYSWGVNRIFGSESPVGRENARLHMAHLSRAVPGGTVAGFGYWWTFNEALAAQSARTLGARFRQSRPWGEDLRFHFRASAANQQPRGAGSSDASLVYARLEGGLAHPDTGFSASMNWERLGGNGDRAFAFPLATLHAWQGYADVFLATPPEGLRDLRFEMAWDGTALGERLPTRIAFRRHGFQSVQGTAGPLGEEWNVELRVVPRPGLAVLARMAAFTTDAPGSAAPWGTDVRKIWVSAEYVHP
ncbi:alginate export family protein [soil metagenome]